MSASSGAVPSPDSLTDQTRGMMDGENRDEEQGPDAKHRTRTRARQPLSSLLGLTGGDRGTQERIVGRVLPGVGVIAGMGQHGLDTSSRGVGPRHRNIARRIGKNVTPSWGVRSRTSSRRRPGPRRLCPGSCLKHAWTPAPPGRRNRQVREIGLEFPRSRDDPLEHRPAELAPIPAN